MKSGAREGRGSVIPVLIVEGVDEEAFFLQTAFHAEIGMLVHNPQGKVQHAEASIGNSVLILERAAPTLPATHCAMRIVMEDPQAAIQAALQNGGKSVRVPDPGPGAHAEAAVSDPQGNIWWIVAASRRPSNEEVQRRLIEQRRQRL